MEDFKSITPVTEQKESEAYRMELLLRILVPYKSDIIALKEYSDLADLLDKETTKIALNYNEDRRSLGDFMGKFTNIVSKLSRDVGEDCFRKYHHGKFKGPFLVGAYQAIMSGALFNYDDFMRMDKELIDALVKNLYMEPKYVETTAPGTRAIPKLIDLTQFGKEYFKDVRGQ